MLIKSADDKGDRLKLLEDLKQQPLNKQQREWLDKELWALRTGIQGEKDAAYYINAEYRDSEYYAVLHDLRIEIDGETAQIDHLLIGHYFAFLLETKNFNGNISINERGEFSVEYGQGKRKGIPSPLEQSYRHERIFSKLLDNLNIRNSLTGEKLKIYHIVLFSPNSIIKRPENARFDTSNIIKADALRHWWDEFKSKELLTAKMLVPFVAKSLLRPKNWISEPGSDVVREYGESIARCHIPADLSVLPDFMQPTPQAVSVSIGKSVVSQIPKPKPSCVTCGKAITPAEQRFCGTHKERFGRQLYCRQHQQAFPSACKQAEQTLPEMVRPSEIENTETEQVQICCEEPNCSKVLTAAVIAYCTEHADKFDGKLYCMFHQKQKRKKN